MLQCMGTARPSLLPSPSQKAELPPVIVSPCRQWYGEQVCYRRGSIQFPVLLFLPLPPQPHRWQGRRRRRRLMPPPHHHHSLPLLPHLHHHSLTRPPPSLHTSLPPHITPPNTTTHQSLFEPNSKARHAQGAKGMAQGKGHKGMKVGRVAGRLGHRIIE